MDPNANLQEQLRIADIVLNTSDPVDTDTLYRLAELVTSLNHWIEYGGPLPSSWAEV